MIELITIKLHSISLFHICFHWYNNSTVLYFCKILDFFTMALTLRLPSFGWCPFTNQYWRTYYWECRFNPCLLFLILKASSRWYIFSAISIESTLGYVSDACFFKMNDGLWHYNAFDSINTCSLIVMIARDWMCGFWGLQQNGFSVAFEICRECSWEGR